jgi:predicted dehydrogenase
LRFGLIGTGYWAKVIHGTSTAQHSGVEFVGVWGRDRAKTSAIAEHFGIKAYGQSDALIEDVEALTFAVPPAVQVPIAIRAAERGRHLLLEKPIALSILDARRLEDAVATNNVASVVFFTQRFMPRTQAWLERVAKQGGWAWGRAETAANIFVEGGPFASSAWRREYGALWDIGPHALSLLWPILGEPRSIVAGPGREDHVHLIARHPEGRSSSLSLSLTAPSATVGRSFYVEGEHGRESLPIAPSTDEDVVKAHQAAIDALIAQLAQPRRSHALDVHFGARVVEVLEAAQLSLTSGCWVDVERAPEHA